MKVEEKILFATGLATAKVREVDENRIAVTLQGSPEYAVLYGTAHVLKDRADREALVRGVACLVSRRERRS